MTEIKTDIFVVDLPDIGEGVVEGEVIEWLKAVNDEISQDEPVVVVMTDKATVELPAPYPGKLEKQYYEVGGVAIKNKPLYSIKVAPGTVIKNKKKIQEKSIDSKCNQGQQSVSLEKTKKEIVTFKAKGGKSLATPPIRKLAKDLQVDINEVTGTGDQGRVTEQDLKEFIRQQGASSKKIMIRNPTLIPELEGSKKEKLMGLRYLTAEKMAESKSEIPHFSYFDQADATRLLTLRKNLKEHALGEGIKLTFMPFFIKALSLTLNKFPEFNSSIDMEAELLITHRVHNVGIAMDTPLGLMVPVLKNVEKMSLYEVIRAFQLLRKKAQSGKLESKDMKESTVTISNFGALGAGGLWATPIINYPNAMILGVARITKQPVVKKEQLVVIDLLNCSWSFDHRIVDGGSAAYFSQEFKKNIENPAQLL